LNAIREIVAPQQDPGHLFGSSIDLSPLCRALIAPDGLQIRACACV
jgi:hypothetical protein